MVFQALWIILFLKDNTYTLTTKDNCSLTECTSGTCSTSSSAVFVSTVTDRIVLDSDNTSMIGIADNCNNIAVYNLTTPGTPARVGKNIITVDTTDQFCGVVGGVRALVFDDNATADDAYGTFNLSCIDNSIGWEYSVTGGLFDNATANVHCAMTYDELSGDNRIFYMAVNNNTKTKRPSTRRKHETQRNKRTQNSGTKTNETNKTTKRETNTTGGD